MQRLKGMAVDVSSVGAILQTMGLTEVAEQIEAAPIERERAMLSEAAKAVAAIVGEGDWLAKFERSMSVDDFIGAAFKLLPEGTDFFLSSMAPETRKPGPCAIVGSPVESPLICRAATPALALAASAILYLLDAHSGTQH